MDLLPDLPLDLLKDFTKHQRIVAAYMAALYQLTQQREAEKVAADWRPSYVNLPSGDCRQLAPVNNRREKLIIVNKGPADVFLSNKRFNISEVNGRYEAGATGEVISILHLASGDPALVLATTGSLYGSAITNNAALNIIETIYLEPAGLAKSSVHHNGFDGKAFRGNQDDENNTLVGPR
jgi:hypothetical protein